MSYLDFYGGSVKGNDVAKDISRSSNAKVVDLAFIQKLGISPGNISIVVEGKKFLVLRAGDYVCSAFIEKYKKKKINSFHYQEIFPESQITAVKVRWDALARARDLQTQVVHRKEMLKAFYLWFWLSQKDVHYYCFIIGSFRSLSRFDKKSVEVFDYVSSDLFIRSAHVAAVAATFALLFDFKEWTFISDIYHASFLLDISLIQENLSFYMKQLCELERLNPQKRDEFMQAKLDGEKTQAFLQHPAMSYQCAKEKFTDCFFEIEMARIISLHHEYRDGSGFPEGMNFNSTADWEIIPILADRLIPYGGEQYIVNESHGFYEGLFYALKESSIESMLPISRNLQLIENEFKKIQREI